MINIYSNPIDEDGKRAKNYKCGYCEEFPEYLLALNVYHNNEGRIVICKSCLLHGVDAINKAYLGRKRK